MISNFKQSAILLTFLLCSGRVFSTDLEHSVMGADVEDSLGKMESSKETNAYISNTDSKEVEELKIKKDAASDFMFSSTPQDLSVKNAEKRKLEDFGYVAPGSFEKNENYLETDKKQMAEDFRKHSSGSFNLSYIKNNYTYDSQNDIINKTISEGYKHIKGGALYLRGDTYFSRSSFLNTYWSLGAGVGYNSGRGIFITGDQSDATFRLWEIPIDLGVGLEIPIYHWFKISGTAGPSVEGLYQNRSDYQQGEKGKNKIQVSYGEFANAQFRFNLSGFSDNLAHSLFTESKITNLSLNLEVRYQNYQNFQDPIKISGTSYGLGFTFEYL